jgi:hypothetical protein
MPLSTGNHDGCVTFRASPRIRYLVDAVVHQQPCELLLSACSRHQQCPECNQASTENKHEDLTIEGAKWIGMSYSVNHATHQSHQTIELQPA